jgi:hypothetical protein
MPSVKSRHGHFQILFVLAASIVSFGAAGALAQGDRWQIAGPLLLFLGILTLINAPFDWASLGLTRALLRRGLELGGWWPYLLAVVDAVFAVVLIVLLTAVSVLSIQLFDALTVHSGGERARILAVGPLLDGIAAHPSAPELWWVYALLLSTMIPSLVNLTIAGASLLRGVPWITQLLLRAMPENRAPASFDQPWMALLLTLQFFIGAGIGVVAQGVLAYVLIVWILPPFGLNLLDLARAVAAPDLPKQAIEFVAQIL